MKKSSWRGLPTTVAGLPVLKKAQFELGDTRSLDEMVSPPAAQTKRSWAGAQ